MISVMKKIEKRLSDSQYKFDFDIYYTQNAYALPISEDSMAGDLDKIAFHISPDQKKALFSEYISYEESKKCKNRKRVESWKKFN
jgi:hypothetical protein